MSNVINLRSFVLFVLGLATVLVGPALGVVGFAVPAAMLGATTLVAAVLEVHARVVRHQRAMVVSWAPAAIGIAVAGTYLVATAPRGPDSGLADGIVVFAALSGAVVLALAVLAVAATGESVWRRRAPRS